ncbi:DUF3800 domain-containing protein [Candidatus Parcubacteria bacterium]|nr:DUF3800 domain-containing protein [Candidatus Parcubacteria bacterium]
MAYIFLDESGDLGFDFSKKRTSKIFIITCLFAPKKRKIEKIVSKTHAELKKKYKKRGGVLHAYHEKPITRQRLLKRLNDSDCSIMTIYLNKERVYTKLQNEKEVLYNYVTNILLDRICTKKLIDINKPISLIASRKETNKFLNLNFKNYLKNSAINNHKLKLSIEIRTPFEERSLQAVDFVSWSIFRKWQYGDDSYYNIIKQKIAEENPLFP